MINDYNFGKDEENKLYNVIKDIFDDNLKQTINKFNRFDFISDKFKIEMKSRNINHNLYPDVFISYNKIDYFLNNFKDTHTLILIFNYIDKILYIKYNDDIFKKFKIQHQNTRIDYKKLDTVIYIPINLLSELKKD